jgi:hypothetical protein
MPVITASAARTTGIDEVFDGFGVCVTADAL